MFWEHSLDMNKACSENWGFATAIANRISCGTGVRSVWSRVYSIVCIITHFFWKRPQNIENIFFSLSSITEFFQGHSLLPAPAAWPPSKISVWSVVALTMPRFSCIVRKMKGLTNITLQKLEKSYDERARREQAARLQLCRGAREKERNSSAEAVLCGTNLDIHTAACLKRNTGGMFIFISHGQRICWILR